VFAVLRSISSLGNIIVMTYTASRGKKCVSSMKCCWIDYVLVKQEIAKEGILPFSLYLAKSYDLSLSRLKRIFSSARTTTHHEKTPVAALLMHLFTTTIFVLVPTIVLRSSNPGTQSYYVIVAIYGFVINITFFGLVALGMLYLRLAPGSGFRRKSQANHWISIAASLILLAASLFPFICLWIPDPDHKYIANTVVSWFVPQTVCATVLAISLIYWFAFRYIVPHVGSNRGRTFVIERIPRFHEEHGYPVQTFEEIVTEWKNVDSSRPPEILLQRERHFRGDLDA
jgi:hypothetical protein